MEIYCSNVNDGFKAVKIEVEVVLQPVTSVRYSAIKKSLAEEAIQAFEKKVECETDIIFSKDKIYG